MIRTTRAETGKTDGNCVTRDGWTGHSGRKKIKRGQFRKKETDELQGGTTGEGFLLGPRTSKAL